MHRLLIKKQKRIINRLWRGFCSEHEQMEYDVVVVGGGPAGLATTIRLKQLEKQHGHQINVCLIEKGSQIGSNILSGNCFEPQHFSKLFPDFKNMDNPPPIKQEVKEEKILFLRNKENSIEVPSMLMLNGQKNHGNYIISLSDLCKWMNEQAQEMGVDVFEGFAGKDLIYDQKEGWVKGVLTQEFGINRDGEQKNNYQNGIQLVAKQTVIAEGARGSLAMKVIDRYGLDQNSDPMSYGIGLKEVWQIDSSVFQEGLVQHSFGWPLDRSTYGGSFMYHQSVDQVHLGFVIGLDYKNPYLNPYQEFQRFKTHPDIKKYLVNGKCLNYGARVINEASFYGIPKLTFKGGMLIGCSASLLNVLKIKGSHNAIGSGIIAADNIYQQLILENQKDKESNIEIHGYQKDFENSEIYKELHEQRNFKNGFKKGTIYGAVHGFYIDRITKGKEKYELRNKKEDHEWTESKDKHRPIQYEKPDGQITFDILENLQRSGTYHDHDQPSHLVVKPDKQQIPLKSYEQYAGLEQRFCPAKVYEFVTMQDPETKQETTKLQINAQNCLHCKTCSIKMVDKYIDWRVPEGGGGPNYSGM